MRRKRQTAILKLISEKDIKTQEQLTESLKKLGFDTTQATVSRDIKEMGLVKTASGDGGYKYSSPKPVINSEQKPIGTFSDTVIDVTYALHTIVIRTFAGMAQAVCASVDMIIGNKILGSIAGDDTILIIMQNEEEAIKMCDELKKIFNN